MKLNKYRNQRIPSTLSPQVDLLYLMSAAVAIIQQRLPGLVGRERPAEVVMWPHGKAALR